MHRIEYGGLQAMSSVTDSVHEAVFWEPDRDARVRCVLCPHDCRIPDGAKGACGVRVNRHGTLYTIVYDRVVARNIDPIEKKPLFHFLPGSTAYSIGTVGCNLRCAFCQNWDISQWPKRALPHHVEWATDDDARVGCPELAALGESIPGEAVSPEEIVRGAARAGAATTAYTYPEPTIFFELALETARLARESGIRNIFVSNGFISEEPLRQIAGLLDAINIDLKSFREETYRRVSRARLAPILEAIRLYHALGVWTEVTTLVIPGLNDSDEELREIAEFIASVDPAIPWHVSQFYPAWKMMDRDVTPVATLNRAREIGVQAGLRFVYQGNVPGSDGESTHCPGCNELVIGRYGLTMLENRLHNGACAGCGERIEGIWQDDTA
jgi:pyruvate formate lyase activating enzyme